MTTVKNETKAVHFHSSHLPLPQTIHSPDLPLAVHPRPHPEHLPLVVHTDPPRGVPELVEVGETPALVVPAVLIVGAVLDGVGVVPRGLAVRTHVVARRF